MPSANHDYYKARAAEERARAVDSNNERVAAVHLELAEKYEALADLPGTRVPLQTCRDDLTAA